VNLPPSGVKYLYDKGEFEIQRGMPIFLLTIDRECAVEIRKLVMHQTKDRVKYEEEGVGCFYVTDALLYRAITEGGDSGGLIVMKGPGGVPIIIGMHVGSYELEKQQTGVALQLSRSFFDGMKVPIEEIDLRTESDKFPFDKIREVPRNQAYTSPEKCMFIKTKLHGLFGHELYAPARAGKFTNDQGEVINPKIKALSKLHQGTFPAQPVPDHLLPHLLWLYPRRAEGGYVLTPEEAINGIPGRFRSIILGTSCGWPLILGNTLGKKKYINWDGVNFTFEPSFRVIVQEYWEKLLRGESPEFIFGDGYKQELIKLAKVLEGIIRLFSVCPLLLTIFSRMYFLDWQTRLHEFCVRGPVSVGINVHSHHWVHSIQISQNTLVH